MFNLVSLLLILVAIVLAGHIDAPPNQLLHFGLLVATGYFFSVGLRKLRLPGALGYIGAGLLLGEGALGIVPGRFQTSLVFIRALFTMIVLARVTRRAVETDTPRKRIRYCLQGIAAGAASFLAAGGTALAVTGGMTDAVAFGLFGATLSPIMYVAATREKKMNGNSCAAVLGGFIAAVCAWGIGVTVLGPAQPHALRLAVMPCAIGIVSVAVGFSWSYFFERLLYTPSSGFLPLFPLGSFFLAYPVCLLAGFDYLFFAIGAGIWYGTLSMREEAAIETSELPIAVILVLFGLALSSAGIVSLPGNALLLAGGITAALVAVRLISAYVHNRCCTRDSVRDDSIIDHAGIILYGPLPLIMLNRFLGGIPFDPARGYDTETVYTIMTTVICLNIVAYVLVRSVSGLLTYLAGRFFGRI